MRKVLGLLLALLPGVLFGAGENEQESTTRAVPEYLQPDLELNGTATKADARDSGETSGSNDLQALVTYDMLDWMTLDADLRGSIRLSGSHEMSTHVASDKIYYVKNTPGYPWDINLYDANFIYSWLTEGYRCENPDPNGPFGCPVGSCGAADPWSYADVYRKSTYNTNIPMMPRYAQGGVPGTRVVAVSGAYQVYRGCAYCGSRDSGGVVHELWGPYTINLGGDLGTQTILKITYFMNCTNTNITSTCGSAETNWYSQRYGWVRWTAYRNEGGSFVVSAGPSIFNLIRNGTIPAYFPCF